MNKNKLSNFIKQIRGVSYKPTDLLEETDVGAVPILRANNIYNGCLNFDELVFVQSKRVGKDQYLRKGDILICASSGSKELVGKAAYVTEDLNMAFGAFCKVIRPNELNYSKYLGYFFQSDKYKHIISSSAQGANINNLRSEHIDELEVEIPQLNIIENSVNTLDHVSHLLILRHQQLEKLDLLVKSRFIEMFGDPILNDKQWKIDSLVNVTNKIGSGATPKGGKESYQAEGISLIRSLNVHDGRFEYDDLAHITDAQAKELDNVKIEKNDVFINITGASVARSCIVPDNVLPARVNQHVSIVRCKTDVVNHTFINQMFLNPSYKKHLLAMGEAGGATRQAITKQQLEKLVIILPPLDLQNQFTTFVHQVDKSKFVIKQSIEKLELLKNKLMQDYFG